MRSSRRRVELSGTGLGYNGQRQQQKLAARRLRWNARLVMARCFRRRLPVLRSKVLRCQRVNAGRLRLYEQLTMERRFRLRWPML